MATKTDVYKGYRVTFKGHRKSWGFSIGRAPFDFQSGMIYASRVDAWRAAKSRIDTRAAAGKEPWAAHGPWGAGDRKRRVRRNARGRFTRRAR